MTAYAGTVSKISCDRKKLKVKKRLCIQENRMRGRFHIITILLLRKSFQYSYGHDIAAAVPRTETLYVMPM